MVQSKTSIRSWGVLLGLLMMAAGFVGCEEQRPRLSAFCDAANPCPSGQQCENGVCVTTCAKDEDCPNNQSCIDGICRSACDSSLDCIAKNGKQGICLDNRCYFSKDPGYVDAGEDLTVDEGEEVVLRGDNSVPIYENIVSYTWELTNSIPKGVTVDLFEAAIKADTIQKSRDVQFKAPKVVTDTTLFFKLTMADDKGNATSDTASTRKQMRTRSPRSPPP